MISPIGIGGKIDPRSPVENPAVTTICPLPDVTAAFEEVELEISGVADVRLDDAGRPAGSTRAVTELSESVIKVTWAVLGVVW